MDSVRTDGPPPIAAFPKSGDALDVRMSATGEDADWFRSLSPAAQDEYRARWAADAARAAERDRLRFRSFAWGAGRGALVFLVTHLMFGFGGILGLAVALVVGAALGLAWTWWDHGPMLSAVTAGPVYAAVWLSFMPAPSLFPMVLFAELIVMPFAAAAGFAREMRQGDGEA